MIATQAAHLTKSESTMDAHAKASFGRSDGRQCRAVLLPSVLKVHDQSTPTNHQPHPQLTSRLHSLVSHPQTCPDRDGRRTTFRNTSDVPRASVSILVMGCESSRVRRAWKARFSGPRIAVCGSARHRSGRVGGQPQTGWMREANSAQLAAAVGSG